jgi:hypothetical protein
MMSDTKFEAEQLLVYKPKIKRILNLQKLQKDLEHRLKRYSQLSFAQGFLTVHGHNKK